MSKVVKLLSYSYMCLSAGVDFVSCVSVPVGNMAKWLRCVSQFLCGFVR